MYSAKGLAFCLVAIMQWNTGVVLAQPTCETNTKQQMMKMIIIVIKALKIKEKLFGHLQQRVSSSTSWKK